MDLLTIGQAAATLVGPFLPYLVKTGKSVEKKIETAIEEQGGEFVWKQAQNLWSKFSDWYADDDEFISIAKLMAAAPDKASRQEELASGISERLSKAPDKTEEVVTALGGEKGIQQLIAGNRAKLRDFRQEAAPGAQQSIRVGDDSEITGGGQFQK